MSTKKIQYDVAVIGGGASGMMAAVSAARSGAKVVLIEKNKFVGRKLGITGKGRCNVTNDCTIREFMENVPTNPRFLYSCITAFPTEKAMDFFEEMGVPLKTERGRRVFPVSDRAADIVNALRKAMSQEGVTIKQASVIDITANDGIVSSVITDNGEIPCRAAVICCGGLSYPVTGSTGDGYALASKYGHSIVPQRPSLVPLESDDVFCSDLSGLTLKNITLSIFENGIKIYTDLGEMLFTHFGISGPLVLSASAHMRHFANMEYYALVDMKPGLDEKALDERILRDFKKYSNKELLNALVELLNRRVIPYVIAQAGLDGQQKVNSVSKESRSRLLRAIKAFRINISGPRPISEAVVTSGGINVKEINPSTMESKLLSGLFFAGEVIDVDAYTGGYNLQIAWSTGNSAGIHAAAYALDEE